MREKTQKTVGHHIFSGLLFLFMINVMSSMYIMYVWRVPAFGLQRWSFMRGGLARFEANLTPPSSPEVSWGLPRLKAEE